MPETPINSPAEIRLAKRNQFRLGALQRRAKIPNRPQLAQDMQKRLLNWLDQEDQKSTTWICCYVDKEPEPKTQDFLLRFCQSGKYKIAVPFCSGATLKLFALESFKQLAPSKFGLLEPPPHLRTPGQIVAPELIDLFIVPGVAFDQQGNRMGYGRGYYDRLLVHAREDAKKLGYCYLQQIVSQIPLVASWDIPMDYLLTEDTLEKFTPEM